MSKRYSIMIMGASYGSLLGIKLALAGHNVHLICLPAEADLINREGAIVRLPIKGSDRLVDDLVSWGDEDAIAERVRAHLDGGASHVPVQALGLEPLEQLRRLAPVLTAL